jgi:hypothetical protein
MVIGRRLVDRLRTSEDPAVRDAVLAWDVADLHVAFLEHKIDVLTERATRKRGTS